MSNSLKINELRYKIYGWIVLIETENQDVEYAKSLKKSWTI